MVWKLQEQDGKAKTALTSRSTTVARKEGSKVGHPPYHHELGSAHKFYSSGSQGLPLPAWNF